MTTGNPQGAVAPAVNPGNPPAPAQPQSGIGSGMQPRSPMANAPQVQRQHDDLNWVRGAAAGAETSQGIVVKAEQKRAEAQARGYWPIRYRLKGVPPNNVGRVIVLDAQCGPRYWEHAVRNPKTGFSDIYEPCPHEFEACPLCPPSGSQDAYFIMLLSVLNLYGYTKKTGEHTPLTKELLACKVSVHGFFDRKLVEFGSLRGMELTLVRDSTRSVSTGNPEFVNRHADADIEAYIKSQGMWRPKTTREGQIIAPENWMFVPFDYGSFLHRPHGERLRSLYGGNAPMGAGDFGAQSGDQGQWGGGRYAPGTAPIPDQGHQPGTNIGGPPPGVQPAAGSIGAPAPAQAPAPATAAPPYQSEQPASAPSPATEPAPATAEAPAEAPLSEQAMPRARAPRTPVTTITSDTPAPAQPAPAQEQEQEQGAPTNGTEWANRGTPANAGGADDEIPFDGRHAP